MAQMNIYVMLSVWLRSRSVRACAASSKEDSAKYTTTVADGRTDSRLSATVRTDTIAAATNPRAAAGTAARGRLWGDRTHSASKATWQPVRHNKRALAIY